MAILVTAVTILGLYHCMAHGSVLQEKITVLKDPNDDHRNVVVVTWKDEGNNDFQCQMFTDQKLIQEVLRTSGEGSVHRPTKEEMREIEEECNSFSLKRRRRDAAEVANDGTTPQEGSEGSKNMLGWLVIFPGTKWCGAGDISKNDDDLGFNQDTDRCCRAHDKCDDLISAGETKHNLTNKTPITKLNCKCDDEFYDCLSRIDSVVSNTVGNSYFNILMNPCYASDYPLSTKCKKYRTFTGLTCREYERDTTKPKEYQWVKAKLYKQIPIPGPLSVTLPF